MPESPPSVFISYAREDLRVVRKLYNDLKRAGANPWLDKESLLPGHRWKVEIKRAIRECRYFLAVLSSNSVSRRGYVHREVAEALQILDEFPESQIFMIPVRLDDCSPSHERLRDLQWVDMFPSWDDGVEKILRAIRVQPGGNGIAWGRIGIIAAGMAMLIALGAWLVPDVADWLSAWLFETPTVPVISITTPTNTPFPPTATPTFTPVPPTPTPELPTPTHIPPPIPTSTSTPAYTPVPPMPTKSSILSCSIRPLDEFASMWEKNRNDLGCPVDNGTVVSPACEEAFEGGHLFWRSDTTQIYIVYDRDKITGQELFSGDWFIGPREWGWDGSNPNGIGLEPPPNRYEPIGGLGWLWREYLGGEEGRLGWATGKEYCFEELAMAQSYQNGLIYKSSDSKTYALLHNDKFIASR